MFGWIKSFKPYLGKDGAFFLEIKRITGLKPKTTTFYQLAFRHSSASQKVARGRINNQRLEFLGDAVLGLVVADFLYNRYSGHGEGFLTSMRSKIVSRKYLNSLGTKMGLHKLLVKKTPRNIQAKSIYGDALEALIGAVYLDYGYQKCKVFIEQKILSQYVDWENIERRIASHKGALLEWSQKNKQKLSLEVTNSWGESHARKYEVSVFLNGNLVSKGVGTSKKRAEEEASKLAYKIILKPIRHEKI